MSYLTDLVQRVLDPPAALRPRLPSLFEAPEPFEGEVASTEAAPALRETVRAATALPAPESRAGTVASTDAEGEGDPPVDATVRGPRSPRRAEGRDAHSLSADVAAVVAVPAAGETDRVRLVEPTAGEAAPTANRQRKSVVTASAAPEVSSAPARPTPAVPMAAAETVAQVGPPRGHRAGPEPSRRRVHPSESDVRSIATVARSESRRRTEPEAPAGVRGAAEPPVVRVTIERIDVRAGEAPQLPPRPAPRREPEHLPLADYLRQRDAGER